VARTVQALDTRYNLSRKMARESGVEDIIKQMFGRLADSFETLSNIQGDIACGSNTSKAPARMCRM
jgi:hypothetical protein